MQQNVMQVAYAQNIALFGLQIFSYSSYNKEGEVGEVTAAALSAKDVRWAKVRAVKEMKERAPTKQYGLPAEPGADLGIEYR